MPSVYIFLSTFMGDIRMVNTLEDFLKEKVEEATRLHSTMVQRSMFLSEIDISGADALVISMLQTYFSSIGYSSNIEFELQASTTLSVFKRKTWSRSTP